MTRIKSLVTVLKILDRRGTYLRLDFSQKESRKMKEDKGQREDQCCVGTFAFFDLEATGLPGAGTR